MRDRSIHNNFLFIQIHLRKKIDITVSWMIVLLELLTALLEYINLHAFVIIFPNKLKFNLLYMLALCPMLLGTYYG